MPDLAGSASSNASRTAESLSFECSWRAAGYDAAWVHTCGELDLASSSRLRSALKGAQLCARMIVLNLRGLTFIDSAGVHAILDAATRAEERGGRLLIARGPAQVDRMLALTGASARLSIFDLDPTEPAAELFDAERGAA